MWAGLTAEGVDLINGVGGAQVERVATTRKMRVIFYSDNLKWRRKRNSKIDLVM